MNCVPISLAVESIFSPARCSRFPREEVRFGEMGTQAPSPPGGKVGERGWGGGGEGRGGGGGFTQRQGVNGGHSGQQGG